MKKKEKILDKDGNFQAALEYYKNAKDTLKKAGIEDGLYKKVKYVQEACATCYLGVLFAIDGYLLQYKIEPDKLPKSYDEYLKVLKKITVKNGKLIKMFKKVYHGLHILGYYRGTKEIETIKLWFSQARWIIEHLTGRRL